MFSTAAFPPYPAAGVCSGHSAASVLKYGCVILSTPGPVTLTSLSLTYRPHMQSHRSLMIQVKSQWSGVRGFGGKVKYIEKS